MAYDPDIRILSVWFVASDKRYEFEDVPPETFAAFKAAFAKGRFFNDHIRITSGTVRLRPATMRDDGKLLIHSNCRLVDAAQPARRIFLRSPPPGAND
ncbi:KTSC domain-containing protein [Mesorhizobium sp. M1393]